MTKSKNKAYRHFYIPMNIKIQYYHETQKRFYEKTVYSIHDAFGFIDYCAYGCLPEQRKIHQIIARHEVLDIADFILKYSPKRKELMRC